MLLPSQPISSLQTDSELSLVLCFMSILLVVAIALLVVANRIGRVEKQREAEKKCPYCAEFIKKDAIICRFCGKDIPVAISSQAPAIQAQKHSGNAARITIPAVIVTVLFVLAVGFMLQGNSESFTYSPVAEQPSISSKSSNEATNNGGSAYRTSDDDTSWFRGGTLHGSKMFEWRNSSYTNRLATAADFIAATQDVDYSNLDGFRKMASDLEICISASGEGGAADNTRTAVISAMCLAVMFPGE